MILLLMAMASIAGAQSMTNADVAMIKVETVHFGAPGAPTREATMIVKTKEGDVLTLESDRFHVQHKVKVTHIQKDSVVIEPADKDPKPLLVHQKKKSDNRGYTVEKPIAAWRQTLIPGDELLLSQPGISDAGVLWKLSLEKD